MLVEKILDNIEAIVSDIEAIERDLGFPARQASDREAFDTLSRIERRLLLAMPRGVECALTNQYALPVPADEDVF